ncbi:MAG TPA: 5'-3' exonuclease H3TH domain-containing protein [Polyangiales bacterium]|nr:5'-3' exonuclease H3TH domain-containing protein [Polyangiales bacterium]
MPRALLIDTNSLFFRAFHGLPPMNTSRGVPTSAVYGFSTLVLKLLREEQPDGIAFARDAKAATFRHVEYGDYKAQRAPIPSPLAAQFSWLDRLLVALDLPTFTVPGFEADDVLATLARELREVGSTVRVVTGDRDLFQTTAEGVDVLFVGRRQQKPIIYDLAAVEARFGVRPERLPSWMALVGDTSDNLIGVRGIGPGTAKKLLAKYHDVADLLQHLDEVTPESLRSSLGEARERIIQNERLARLESAVPLPLGPRVGLPSAAAIERVRELFVELEFKSLLGRLPSAT